jgi:hypothetical protein
LATQHVEVVTEASNALYKFVNKQNYLYLDHLRTVLGMNVAVHLLGLLDNPDMFTEPQVPKIL